MVPRHLTLHARFILSLSVCDCIASSQASIHFISRFSNTGEIKSGGGGGGGGGEAIGCIQSTGETIRSVSHKTSYH